MAPRISVRGLHAHAARVQALVGRELAFAPGAGSQREDQNPQPGHSIDALLSAEGSGLQHGWVCENRGDPLRRWCPFKPYPNKNEKQVPSKRCSYKV